MLYSAQTSIVSGSFGVIAFTAIANPNDPETMLVCVLYSISLVFQATEILQYWFQAKLLSTYIAITSLAAYVVVSAYRCFLLIKMCIRDSGTSRDVYITVYDLGDISELAQDKQDQLYACLLYTSPVCFV